MIDYNNRLPDFMIIGGMKCGTTSLHDYLGLHPEIYTSTPKEIHYFSTQNYSKYSLQWYQSHFSTSKSLAGTSPQNYTKHHLVEFRDIPKRIFKHIPKIKLIYILRDPIERIYSHYYEAQEGGYAPKKGLNAYLANFKDNHYVLTSCYFYQIQAYLPYFPKSQIHILSLEELRDNRLVTLNKVFDFLSVHRLDDESLFQFKSNEHIKKTRRNKAGDFLYSKATEKIRQLFPNVAKKVITSQSIFKDFTQTGLKKEKIDPQLEEEIKSFLREDINKLREWTALPFSEWKI